MFHFAVCHPCKIFYGFESDRRFLKYLKCSCGRYLSRCRGKDIHTYRQIWTNFPSLKRKEKNTSCTLQSKRRS